ncbi:MAG TPA: transcriptional repressor [Blastocatellia bacterium]|nr:transcriptional repressor [Blastocatellia bacterium]
MEGRSNQENSGVPALTRQRQVVLEVVRDSSEHLTASEVYEAARLRMPTISFATVYNSLRYLREAGLVREITFGNAASRYDRETSRHDHAICTGCGKLVDFEFPEMSQLMDAAARLSHFTPESIHLTLMGRCPDCQKS